MKRKMYEKLIEWKNRKDKKPLIIYGARQVGKTYLIEEFAKNNYDYVYSINFEFDKDAGSLFSSNLDIKTLLLQLSSYKTNIPIKEGKTLLFFDEVQKCPQVLTSLKTFALDGRFDVICSGSTLGIIMPDVSSYPVGYVETLQLRAMSFEEFLLANGHDEEQILMYKQYFIEEKPMPEGLHNTLNKMFLHYIAVGGMPAVVKTYVKTSNFYDVLKVQKQILNDYKNDLAKYTSKTNREKARECFESIPDQLAKENKKFQYKMVKQGGTARSYGNSLAWIVDAGIGVKVHKLKTFDIPLRAYRDINAFKFYLNDTGLLIAFYNENVTYELINGNLGVFKGGIFENVVAQCLIDNGLDIYYYQKNDNLEIDFITILNNKIIPIEVKSGRNTKGISIRNVVEKENLDYGIIFSMNNLNCSNSKIKFLPLYMLMFLKNDYIF